MFTTKTTFAPASNKPKKEFLESRVQVGADSQTHDNRLESKIRFESRIRILLIVGAAITMLTGLALDYPQAVFIYSAVTFPLYFTYRAVFTWSTGYAPGRNSQHGFRRESEPQMYWILFGLNLWLLFGTTAVACCFAFNIW